MGILSRFKTVMKANMNALMEQAEDPEKAINSYMRELNRDLGAVKAETAAVLLNERRAKSLLGECQAEMKKLQRYADKSVEAGDEEAALKFLDKKLQQENRLNELTASYELAASTAESMKQMQDKLVSDIEQLEARHAELKGKLAAVKVKEGLYAGSSNDIHSSIEAMEEKALFAINKAEALEELRNRKSSEEAELADRIEKLKKNE